MGSISIGRCFSKEAEGSDAMLRFNRRQMQWIWRIYQLRDAEAFLCCNLQMECLTNLRQCKPQPHCHLLKNNFKHIHWAEVKGRPASPHVSACAAFSKQPWFSQQRAGSALCKSYSCWGVRGWSEVLEGQTGNIESFQQQGFEKSETLWASLKPAMSCFCRWMREPDVISPSREHVIPAGSSQRMSSSNVSESIHFKEKVPDVISIKMNIKALSTSQKRTILKPALSCL